MIHFVAVYFAFVCPVCPIYRAIVTRHSANKILDRLRDRVPRAAIAMNIYRSLNANYRSIETYTYTYPREVLSRSVVFFARILIYGGWANFWIFRVSTIVASSGTYSSLTSFGVDAHEIFLCVRICIHDDCSFLTKKN